MNRPVDALPGSNYKVACVKIEFNNYEVIQLLQQKANLLYWGKVEEAQQLSNEIEQLLETDANRVWRPVKVFITFQTLLGFRWAIKNKIREGLRSETPLIQDLINEGFRLERC